MTSFDDFELHRKSKLVYLIHDYHYWIGLRNITWKWTSDEKFGKMLFVKVVTIISERH